MELAVSGLNAALLIEHTTDRTQYVVNLDPQVLELIAETKYLQKMNLEVSNSAAALVMCEERLKKTYEV